ncbi:hypothetical protein ONR75_15315 [Rhodopseudomonas sp. P2A-2r]|uniref:hypothetical protein n=1 Tax=Rhodopseudomonas sp. P2A-2r TaxID=2991972 RepID=UPI00223433C6|nr:hypothetical protein [Rhodopseudomonas sp. P2A-2r]UZE51807.1 hypothetical protein ONR75_15315 [Rhodopseudomonas sp. P2A-2r]
MATIRRKTGQMQAATEAVAAVPSPPAAADPAVVVPETPADAPVKVPAPRARG